MEDGRFISAPLDFYPTLSLATPAERSHFEVSGSSVYWPELDADIGEDWPRRVPKRNGRIQRVSQIAPACRQRLERNVGVNNDPLRVQYSVG